MYSMIPFGRMNTSWNDLFDDFERRMFPADRGELPAFRTDIRDEGDHFLLEADLPGFRKEDIDLHLQDGVLTITAKRQEEQEEKKEGKYLCRERRMGSCARAFDVSGIREEDITAAFEDGVLKLTLPKQGEPVPQSRRIVGPARLMLPRTEKFLENRKFSLAKGRERVYRYVST